MRTDIELNTGYTPVMTDFSMEWIIHEAQAMNTPVRAATQFTRRRT